MGAGNWRLKGLGSGIIRNVSYVMCSGTSSCKSTDSILICGCMAIFKNIIYTKRFTRLSLVAFIMCLCFYT